MALRPGTEKHSGHGPLHAAVNIAENAPKQDDKDNLIYRPRNRVAAATCSRGHCELPAILRLTQAVASG